MNDIWGTVIWAPDTAGLDLQLLLPQNIFLLHAQDELLFKDGSLGEEGEP